MIVKSIRETANKLNKILTKGQKKRAIGTLAVTISCSVFELLGVTAILPFLQALVTPDVLMSNKIVIALMSLFSIASQNDVMILVVIGVILVYLVKNAYIIWAYYIQFGFSSSIQKELSIKMLQSYLGRPYVFFLDVNSGELLRGCSEDVRGIYFILSYCFSIISEIFSTLVIGMYIFASEPIIAFAMLVLLGFVGFGIVFVFKPKMKRIGQRFISVCAIRNKTIYQILTGVKEIYVTQRKENFTREYDKAAYDEASVEKVNGFLSAIPERIIEGICISGMVGIVAVRLSVFGDGMEFIPRLGTFAMAAFKILPSVGKITNKMNSIMYHMPSLNNVYKIIVEADKYQEEQKNYLTDNNICSLDDGKPFHFKSELSIRNVSWKYPQKELNVLNGISLSIHKGESVALIGASGAGKTTLADIIMGILKPQEGSVLLDGIDVFAFPKCWANTIGYVPQQVFLIDDTVRANVTFGLKGFSDEVVWDALERAQIKSFIEGLPDGLDTIVGERGVKFSGGQRQRIAIARALFAKPQILVLDEATAALDNETESSVMESIDALQGQITMIIVAHRLTTIRNCDIIYEIQDGIAKPRSKEDIFG